MSTQTVRLLIIGIFLLTAFFSGEKSYAVNEAPQEFTLDGQMFQPGSNAPLLDSNAKIKIQVLNPGKNCILYEEQQTVNTSNTDGRFTIQVGSVVGSTKRTGGDPGLAMSQVFQNSGTIAATTVAGQNCPFNAYTPSSADKRYFRIIVTPSATNVAETQTPDMDVGSVPNALVAQSVQGLEKSNILQVTSNGMTSLTQANLEDLFTTPNYSTLQSLLSGSYVQTSANGAGLPAFASNPTSPPQGSIWYDSVTHEVKYQNNLGPQVLGVAGSGVSTTTTFGSTPNSAGLSISGTTINMQPADATNPGGVSTGAQTLAGAKTFSGAASFTSAGTGVAVTNNATVGGTLGVTGNTTVGGTLGVTSTLSVGSSAAFGGSVQTNGNLYFSGTAATNPMLKRNTTALEVKLGDDSSLAVLRAADPSGSTDVATKGYVDTATSGVSGKVAKTGDSMSGNLVLENQKQVRFSETTGGGSNYAAIQAPATLAADYTLTLPADDGANGEVLSTNGAGVLSWVSAATGTVSTVGNFNATSTAKGLSISGSDVILHAADGTNPGAVTTGAQTLAGAKTFSSQVTASAAGTGLSVTNNATVGGTLGVTGNTTLGGTLGVTGNSTVGGTLAVTGNTTLSGTFGVTGTSTFSDNVSIANQKQIRFNETTGGGSNYAAIQAPATLAADYTLTLPADDGANGEVLSTNGSGVLSWTSAATGTVSTAGTFNATSTAKGLSISGSDVILHAADGTNPGAVTTGAQTLAGAKTFSGAASFTSAGTGVAVTNNATIGGTLGVTGNTTVGGTLGVTGAASFSSTGSFADNVTMANQKEMRFSEATGGGSNYVAIRAPAALASDFTLTLPVDDGTADQVLKTDGSGNLAWTDVTTGTVNAIGNFGSTPNTKGMTISSGNINLEPADATNPGAVSTAAQTFAGAKTFSGAASFSAAGTGLAVTNNATVGGTLAVTSNTTVGGTLGVTGNTTLSGTLGVTGVATYSDNVIVNNEKEIRFKEASGSGANYISLKAPTTLAGDFTLTLPVDDGTADQVLKTDGSGNLAWVTPAVTSAVSVTAPITNSGTGAAPNIGISQATTSTNGYLSSTDWNTFNNKQTATLADGKILVGDASSVATAVTPSGDVAMTNAGAITVNKIKGITVSAAPTVTGQVLRYDGTNLVPNFISMIDLRSTVTGTTALASSCTAAQTLTYNTVGDNLTCSNIAIGDSAITYASQTANKFLASPSTGAGAPTYRTIAAADLPVTGTGAAAVNGGNSFGAASTLGNNDNFDLGLKTNNLTRMTITASGNVGIGTISPTAKLDVRDTNPTNVIFGGQDNTMTFYNGDGSSLDRNEIYFNTGAGADFSLRSTSSVFDIVAFDLGLPTISILKSNGNVGIGTTNPGSRFEAVDTQTVTSGTVQSFNLTQTITPSATSTASYNGLKVTSTNNSGQSINAASSTINGIISQAIDSGASSLTTNLVGVAGYGDHNGGGTTDAWVVGVKGSSRINGTGTTSNAVGVNGVTDILASTGTMTNAFGGYFQIQNSGGGTITSAYGASIAAPSNTGGSISNYYGLYVANPGSYASTNYAIYSQGGTNYFGGNVGIGTTSPTKPLEVVGGTTFETARFTNVINPGISINSISATDYKATLNFAHSGTIKWQVGVDINNTANQNFFIYDGVAADTRFYINSSGNVGVGTTAPEQKLEVNGGVRLNTATAKPTCNSTARGTFWVTQGGAGVKDSVEVCAKDAADAYAWRTLY